MDGLEEVMERKFPCLQNIYPTVGCAAEPGEGEPCGATRYCENCEQCLMYIGQAWEMHAMEDALLNWFRRAVMHWGMVEDAADKFFVLDPAKVHRCGSNCPHRIQS